MAITNKQFLDKDGVDYLAQGLKAKIPTKVSQLENDSQYKTTDTNTTYTITSGDANGQIKISPSDAAAYNVDIKGLKTNAFTDTIIPTKISDLENDSNYARKDELPEWNIIDNEGALINAGTLEPGLYYNKNAICYFKTEDFAMEITKDLLELALQMGYVVTLPSVFYVGQGYITDMSKSLAFITTQGTQAVYYVQYQITTSNLSKYTVEYIHYIKASESHLLATAHKIGLVVEDGFAFKSVYLNDSTTEISLPLPRNTLIIGTGTDMIVELEQGLIILPDGTQYTITKMSSVSVWLTKVSGSAKEEVIISNEQPENMDWKLWIDPDNIETINSEVVNSLDGDEEDKAPSVKAVKEKLDNLPTPDNIYPKITIDKEANLNQIWDSGFYSIATTECSGKPEGAGLGSVIVEMDNGAHYQIFIDEGDSPKIWKRGLSEDETFWKEWILISELGGKEEVFIQDEEPEDGKLWIDPEEDGIWMNNQDIIIAADTLPIGSVVDYNGTEIPNGWKEVECGSEDYSTEEVFTGKHWIDGKKIYRKVIEWDIPSQTTSYTNIVLLTEHQIIKWEAFCMNENIVTNLLFDRSITNIYLTRDNGAWRLHYKPNSGDLIGYNYCVIEYTKTTD